mgnify:CR=1 FL=1
MCVSFVFQAEDGIRDLVRSRGLGDVYKRQRPDYVLRVANRRILTDTQAGLFVSVFYAVVDPYTCLLYTSDAADERSSVDLGGRRILKKKTTRKKIKETSATH